MSSTAAADISGSGMSACSGSATMLSLAISLVSMNAALYSPLLAWPNSLAMSASICEARISAARIARSERFEIFGHKSLQLIEIVPTMGTRKTNRAGRTVSGTALAPPRSGRGGADFLRGGWRAATQLPR